MKLLEERTLAIAISLFLLSLIARAVFLVAVEGVNSPLEGDEPSYHDIAVSFLEGNGWGIPGGDVSYRPPLISFQFVLAYLVFWPDPAIARWTMVLFGSFVAPLLYVLARRLDVGAFMALGTGVAWALYPPAIWYSALPATETTAALLTVAGVFAFVWASCQRSSWPAALTGAIWAMAALNRPVYLLVPFATLAAQIVYGSRSKVEWKWSRSKWLVALLAFVLVMAPWTVRNYLEHGVFMPTTSGFGWVLMMSNGTLDHPVVQQGAYYKNPELGVLRAAGKSEVERDVIARQLAFDEIKRNWRLLPVPVLNRAKNFWTPRPDPYDPATTRNDLIMYVIWVPVLMCLVVSPAVRNWRRYWPAMVVVVVAFITTLPFWSQPRFRFPVDPILIMLAASGAAWLTATLRRVRSPRLAVGPQRSGALRDDVSIRKPNS